MKFVKGQWYTNGESYYQHCSNQQGIDFFRLAGVKDEEIWLTNEQLAKLTPASLTPDLSDAKVGDECWHGVGGFMIINDIYDDGKAISIKYDNSPKAKKYREDESDLGGITIIYTYRNGYMPFRHPELFNSFAQFISYWAEEGLKMKGGSDA